MLYTLTLTPGLASLGWSPTGSTHNLVNILAEQRYNPPVPLGTYRGLFASFALLKGNLVIPSVRSFPDYTKDFLVCVPDSHKLHTHTHTHTQHA